MALKGILLQGWPMVEPLPELKRRNHRVSCSDLPAGSLLSLHSSSLVLRLVDKVPVYFQRIALLLRVSHDIKKL